MNDERFEKISQDLRLVMMNIKQARDSHEQMEINIGNNLKSIEQELGRDLLTQREYQFFIQQLEYVKDIFHREEDTYYEYEHELIQTQNHIEEELEKIQIEKQKEDERLYSISIFIF